MSGVGAEIKRRREELGLSQPRLAVKAGVAVSAVSQIENGRRSPNLSTLEKIADALDVGVVDLLPKAQAQLPFEDAAAAGAGKGSNFTATVVRAIDSMIGLRVVARDYRLKWTKQLERFRETGGAAEEGATGEMLIIADSLHDQFIEGFLVIGQAARIEGRNAPHEWPQNIKDLVYEAGVRVEAATEIAMRLYEECRPHPDREKVIAEEFSVGAMPEELTRDPAWSAALEEARAIR